MDALLYFLEMAGRMILLSGLLMLAYVFFLRRRADYRLCRRLLLTVPFLCLAVPALRFAYMQLSEPRAPRQVVVSRAQAEEYLHQVPGGSTADTVLLPGKPLPAAVSADYDRPLRAVVWGIPAVSALLLLLMGGQLLLLGMRCRRMARKCSRSADGIVRCREVDTPFSFGRSVFLPSERLTADGERMIVMHELAHIRLGHSAEGLLMEAFCRLLWFNPLMWVARKELRNVQEFEADRQVLDAGTEILAYQTLLLEEAMKTSPVFADGFNRSFVRRRFVEMKACGRRRYAPSMRLLAVVAAVCMTGLASAGRGKEAVLLKIVDDAPSVARIPASETAVPAVAAPVDMQSPDSASREGQPSATAARTEMPEDGRPTRAQDGWPILYDLPMADGSVARGLCMRHVGDETHLVFSRTVDSDDDFFKFGGPECYLVDCATGVHYQARRSVPAEAWDHFHLRGMKGKRIMVAVVFPRLPDNVREVALYRVTTHLQSDERLRVKDILTK